MFISDQVRNVSEDVMARKISLMDKKKHKRRKRIIQAATALFQHNGYADTTISDIADQAEVGVGTIYNYFSSKNDILLNLVADICIEKKPDEIIYENDPVKTLYSYIYGYFDEFMIFDKAIWRGWFAALFTEPNLFARAYALDMKIAGELEGICEQMQNRNMVSNDVPAREIASTVYVLFISWMMSFIMLADMDIRSTKQEFEKQVKLVFEGFKK
jgi:AcrR family transcriptional regulator